MFGATLGYSSYVTFAPVRNAAHHLEINLSISFPEVPMDPGVLDGTMLLLIGEPELVLKGYDFILLGLKDAIPVMIYNLGQGELLKFGLFSSLDHSSVACICQMVHSVVNGGTILNTLLPTRVSTKSYGLTS